MDPTPVVLVTGVEPAPMAAAVMALQCDLPQAVVVRHHVDVSRGVLERVVSDLTGVLEREEVDLAHACVSCAIREDVVPTLRRVAEAGRWSTVLAHLPAGAEPDAVCHVLTHDASVARTLRVGAVVAALSGPGLEDDLVGDDLLAERGLENAVDDRRGVGEVAADLVEHADVVVLSGRAEPAGLDVVRLLARPDARVVTGTDLLRGCDVRAGVHDHARTLAWTSAFRRDELPSYDVAHAWRVDLCSRRPFHPGRLLLGLERLGSGRHRSRGSFWLPTRREPVVWKGAGGQVSIGAGPWRPTSTRLTRIVLTGPHTPPAHLREAFESMLVQDGEPLGVQAEDGFEQWLGPLRDVA